MNLREMFGLRVPIISVVIGEGGSGGALAIGCANRNLIMENSVYYVASPEACAAILWRSRADAALVRCLRLFWPTWRTGGRGSWLDWRPCGLRSRRPMAELASFLRVVLCTALQWQQHLANTWLGAIPGVNAALVGSWAILIQSVCCLDGSPPPGWPLWASAAWSKALLDVVGQGAWHE